MIVFFIRRRVKCIGGRFCLSILDLRLFLNGESRLDEMLLKLLKNIDLIYLIVYDYVIMIMVMFVK